MNIKGVIMIKKLKPPVPLIKSVQSLCSLTKRGKPPVNLTLTVNVNVLPSLNSSQAASTLKFNISIYCVLFS